MGPTSGYDREAGCLSAFDHGAGAPRPQQIPRIKNLGMMVSELNTTLWETLRGASLIAKQFGLEYAR
jgi:transposase